MYVCMYYMYVFLYVFSLTSSKELLKAAVPCNGCTGERTGLRPSKQCSAEVDTFRRQFHFIYEEVPVTLYRCSESGLRVVAAQVGRE